MKLFKLATNVAAQWLTERVIANMIPVHQQLLLNGIRGAIGEYFQLVPIRFRQKDLGLRFGAAATGTADVTANESGVTFTGAVPVDGATVILAGDAAINRATVDEDGDYTLQLPYGGSTGSVVATVYRDVQVIPWEIGGMITDPRDARSTDSLPFKELPTGGQQIVSPETLFGYRIEQGGTFTVMRIIPAPVADLPVLMTVEIKNIADTGIASLTHPTLLLPIDNDHAARIVEPLCAERLITHPLFKSVQLEKTARLASERARADLALIRPRVGAGATEIDTPFP